MKSPFFYGFPMVFPWFSHVHHMAPMALSVVSSSSASSVTSQKMPNAILRKHGWCPPQKHPKNPGVFHIYLIHRQGWLYIRYIHIYIYIYHMYMSCGGLSCLWRYVSIISEIHISQHTWYMAMINHTESPQPYIYIYTYMYIVYIHRYIYTIWIMMDIYIYRERETISFLGLVVSMANSRYIMDISDCHIRNLWFQVEITHRGLELAPFELKSPTLGPRVH